MVVGLVVEVLVVLRRSEVVVVDSDSAAAEGDTRSAVDHPDACID